MSSYGELIQALGVLKNVKEKRHGIKTLSSLCANRQFQVRIVQRGGWKNAILPLIISLDEECRKYAALAIANLSFAQATHQQLLDEEVFTHLVPILYSEECPEVVIYVLNTLGNFASSSFMWPQMQHMKTVDAVVSTLRHTDREETKLNALFCLANMTEDPYQRAWMMENDIWKDVWELLQHPSYTIMEYSLATLRGLSAENSAQDLFPKMGIVPILIGIFNSNRPLNLKALALDIFHHLSFLHSNAPLLMEPNVTACIQEAAKPSINPDFLSISISMIANICECVELHDAILESPLFEVLSSHVLDENVAVRVHVYRAMMQLSLSPRYHHVILSTGAVANACPIAMMERLPFEVRTNVLQMMGAVCATHPTTPTDSDIVDILHLACTETENIEIRRAACLVLANASADDGNKTKLLQKPYIEVLTLTMSKATDVVLTDYLMQFFHNMCKMDTKAGSMLMQAGYHKHMFIYERLESLSVPSAIYLCDTLRVISEDAVVRDYLLQEQMFVTLMDAWVMYTNHPKITPHLALMCSAFCFHVDCHEEFVLQGGVRLIMELYTGSKVEHVRLCCVLSLLYLAESDHAQKSIFQERGMQMLLHACENETHIDLITNSLKALIPFAASDDYRPQLGMDGALDTVSSFLFSDQLSLQQLGVFLLQNLLELRGNRQIFLGLSDEKKCEEDYLDPLVKFLPIVTKGPPSKSGRISRKKSPGKKKKDGEPEEYHLTPHDPFILRCTIHSLALLSLEHHADVHAKFIALQLPQSLYNLFYSEHIDRSSGEAIVLFFVNALHGSPATQRGVMRGIDVMPMLLSAKDMGFSSHTNVRCLSALLCVARQPDYRRPILAHIELIMANLNSNLNVEDRDENFYSAAALHCALLCELASAPAETHEFLAKVGVIEAFLVFITVAGRGLRDEICIELLMGAVLGISTLVASPTCGMVFMRNLLFPATRLQLFMSLLRLPQEDINSTFHLGTFGLRTLQRAVSPNIQPNELHVDHLKMGYFLDLCSVKPSDFIYRHVVRTLCLLLGDPETRRRVEEAISPQNVVPTCLFALTKSEDIFVQVFGYLLVASFVHEASLVPSFVGSATIVNEILGCCRRSSELSSGQELQEEPLVQKLAALGAGHTTWTPQSVQLKRFMLSLSTLAQIGERVKERYNVGMPGSEHVDPEMSVADETGAVGLLRSSRMFLQKLPAICLRDIDTDKLIGTREINEMQEYLNLLRIIITHNSLMTRIDLDARQKGGLIPHLDWKEERRKRPPTNDLVVHDLRIEFKTLRLLQQKTDGLLDLTDRLIEINACRPLIIAIMEFLSGMTYLSPMSVSTPAKVFDLLGRCPEWLQSNLTLLLANSLAEGMLCDPELEDWREKGRMMNADSDHLFTLIATSGMETRLYILGTLANLAAQPDFFTFVSNTGVFRVLKPLPSRAYFAENFAQLLETLRMLANLTCRKNTHDDVVNENVVGFLRDTLRHVCALLHSGSMGSGADPQAVYTRIDVDFEEDDMPPLGLRIRWDQPAQIIQVLPDTPASRLTEGLMEGDELMEVNGVDVSEMEHAEIAPMFESRPLHLLFRRKVGVEMPAKEQQREIETNLKVEEINQVQFYGDREQYVECFHLALLTIHNLATSNMTHKFLLADPKILNILVELITSEIVVPSLRRLIFSTLTCFAQKKDIAGRIFYQMSDYFMACEHADANLQKYIMLCANLFYTSMEADEIKPDRSMLIFVGRLSDMQGAETANMALVEILHGMSRAPKELRGPLVCRETMVLTVQLLQFMDQWNVQLRAFEAAYFMTLGTCDPNLWAHSDLVPKAVKAAGVMQRFAEKENEKVYFDRSDALWEICMRMVDMCLKYEELVRNFGSLPDLDRYMIDIFGADDKPPVLAQCAAHLMSGLLRTDYGGSYWSRWKTLGVVDKILKWFRNFKEMIRSHDTKKLSRRSVGERGGGNKDFDQVLNMLIFAIENDPSFVSSLMAEDVVFSIGSRILSNVSFYRTIANNLDENDHVQVMDIETANVSYRTIAQLLTALTTTADGLKAMGGLDLEAPLVSLLELPPADYRIPTWIMLCTMSAAKATCTKLVRAKSFLGLLNGVAQALEAPGSPYPAEELEYVICILDRACCFPELAQKIQSELLSLLLLILHKAESVDAQLMAIRAITRCAFVEPECLDTVPAKSLPGLYYIMAMCNCLKAEGGEEAMAGVRQHVKNLATAMRIKAPDKAKLASHFARAVLCEAVSVSRNVCSAAFPCFDGLSMLDNLAQEFEESVERITQGEKTDVICAELLNGVCAMFQTTLNVVFRQGTPGGAEDELFEGSRKQSRPAKDAVGMVTRMIDSVYGFFQFGKELDRRTTRGSISSMIREDIRTMYFMTALLHEVCAKDLRSTFLAAVRTKSYYKLLEATIQLAVSRMKAEVEGPPPKDLFQRGLQGTGEFNSPMLSFINGYQLPLVFEHLFVCLRHLLVQCMYVPTPDSDDRHEPWVWDAQYPLKIHMEVMTWMPDVLKRYGNSHLTLRVEMVRYVAAMATYYEAPEAVKPKVPASTGLALERRALERAALAEGGSAGAEADDEQNNDPAKKRLVKIISPTKPEFIAMFLEAFEAAEDDPCSRTLSGIAMSNLVEYERQFVVAAKTKQRDMKVDGLIALIPPMVELLNNLHDFPREIGIPCMAHSVRFFITAFAFGSQPLAVESYQGGVWEAIDLVYRQFFTDELKVPDVNDYVAILKEMVTFARNWICSGCMMEEHTQQRITMRKQPQSTSKKPPPGREQQEETAAQRANREKREEKDMRLFGEVLSPVPLLNFFVDVVLKLTASPRTVPDLEGLKDYVFEDVLLSFQTLFKRQEEKAGKINWKELNTGKFDSLLEEMHTHRRRRRGGERDDETVINTLYLITKLGYQYTRGHFPDYLMEVAYGKREAHSKLQDVAAICCAIIFTTSKGNQTPSVNLAAVITDYSDFVHSMSLVPDPRMQLWHFRTITGWSQRPKVLEDVSCKPAALSFIVKSLLDEILGRYAVVFVHNISCLRSYRLVNATGSLGTVCEAYRRCIPGSQKQGDNTERRMLRRLMLATLRNCTYLVSDLNKDLADEDLVAITHLCSDIEGPDLPLYFATLMNIVKRVDHSRVARVLPRHVPLVEICIRRVLEHADSVNPGQQKITYDETDLYDYELAKDEDEEEEEPDGAQSPDSPASADEIERLRAPSKAKRGRKKRTDDDAKTKGLGKAPSLYQQARRKGAARAQQAAAIAAGEPAAAPVGKKEQATAMEKKTAEQEFMYFAAMEILTHTTFKESADEIWDAVDKAFETYPLMSWLTIFGRQAALASKQKMVLDDFYVHMNAKFIWHGWSNEIFRHHFGTATAKQAVAELIPFFFEWPNEDVSKLIYQVCLYSRMHQFQNVCDYLVKGGYARYPELAAILLSSALVDTDALIKPYQAAQFMTVFVDLLQRRSLSRGALKRIVLGIETSLLTDHPKGLAAYMIQRESDLLADLLEQLASYSETGFIKQAMVVALVQTVGAHYKALPELDDFVLRVLELGPGLLENEFVLFLPVLHRLCSVGGKRVQSPVLSRSLHLRIARILEKAVTTIEDERREAAAIAAGKVPSGEEKGQQSEGPQLNARQQVQWILALFAVLAGNELDAAEEAAEQDNSKGRGHSPNQQFDSFVCVDLLPILVRILRTQPESFEASCVLFLISATSTSPCIAPHVPDILKLAERAFLPRIDHPTVDHDALRRRSGSSAEAEAVTSSSWQHMKFAEAEKVSIGMRRSFIHLLGSAGFLPKTNPGLLRSSICFKFLRSLQSDPYLFEDPCAPLHCKLLALAHLCARQDDHQELINFSIFEILADTEEQISEEATKQPRDLRIHWLHAVTSFARLSGMKFLRMPKAVRLFNDGFEIIEAMMHDSQRLTTAAGVALALECQQAWAAVMSPLSIAKDFEESLRCKYTMLLLELIASGPLAGLRMTACKYLAKMVSEGYNPEHCGAVLLSTDASTTFRQLVGGPSDTLAAEVAKLMIAFVKYGTYGTHVHILQGLEAVMAMLGDAAATQLRIYWLAELFVAMTTARTADVIDVLIEQRGINAFLSLARSNLASRRDLVQKWLEAYGSSLYEIDEVMEVFQKSSLHGMMFIAARCALDTTNADNLRRVIFSLVKRRIDTWRSGVFGVGEFLREDIINSMVPMCELQPDLVAALLALFHELHTQGEFGVLDRVWDGGHFVWLCKRMSHKSAAQIAHARSSGLSIAPLGRPWESHSDLICSQGIALRLLWHMYDHHNIELMERAVKKECVVKHWREFLTYYFSQPWPMRDSREVADATETDIIFAMLFAKRLVMDVNLDAIQQLVIQGMMGMAFAVLLPTPRDQAKHRTELKDAANLPPTNPEDLMDLEEEVVRDAKILAGAVITRLMEIPDAYRWMRERRFAGVCGSMFAQLHHWREFMFVHQGSVAVVPTVPLMERQASLYLALLWVLNIEWCLEHLGIGAMSTLCGLFLQVWGQHPNILMQHYCLRLLSQLFTVQPVYVSIMADPVKSELVKVSMHRTFGKWDVRALRQVVRLLCAALAYSLKISTMPSTSEISIARALTKPDGHALNELMKEGGVMQANQKAAANLLLPSFLAQIITWCEHPNGDTQAPGDTYGRIWALWIVAAVLVHRVPRDPEQQAADARHGRTEEPPEPDELLIFKAQVSKRHLERRKRVLEEQAAIGVSAKPVLSAEEDLPPDCRARWLTESLPLSGVLSKMVGRCMKVQMKESQILACFSASRFSYDLPHFLNNGVFCVEGPVVVRCLGSPEKHLNLCALHLVAVLASYRLPLNSQTIGEDFLHRFFALQREVIEGIAGVGEGPYDLLARWLHSPLGSLPCETDFRCLITYMIGQCVCPPLAEAPKLNKFGTESVKKPTSAADLAAGEDRNTQDACPPVASCGVPPKALLDALAAETLREDLRLRQAQVKDTDGHGTGPIYSTNLCHLLYAIAVMVPLHAKAAANSYQVRGVAFSQLMKVQQIVARGIPSHKLYDPADGKRAKLFLYLRATAVIRNALQCITGSWLAADYGKHFNISDEGGRDFVQYMSKHINQAYNNKTALTRVSGTPWERVMLSQGPTETIAELFLKVCSTDVNLAEASRLGGQQALHSLSRYGEEAHIRQQATVLLTKLAVMNA